MATVGSVKLALWVGLVRKCVRWNCRGLGLVSRKSGRKTVGSVRCPAEREASPNCLAPVDVLVDLRDDFSP